MNTPLNTRLPTCLAALAAQKRKAFVAFIMAGDPDLARSQAIMDGLPEAGADIIELGMPFTDPMADGAAIQRAGLRALKAGQTLAKTLAMVAAFRQHNQKTPVLLMGYYNPIYHYGVARFLKDAATAGIDGLIMVDLPPEEDAELCLPATACGLHFIRLATPTSDAKRLKQILPHASGFLYYVSIAGVTGTATANSATVKAAVQQLRDATALPIMIGFGIRDTASVAQFAAIGDGVVVGSALVDEIGNNLETSPEKIVTKTLSLVQKLAGAAHK